jgi:hypothetical protein
MSLRFAQMNSKQWLSRDIGVSRLAEHTDGLD